MSALSFLSWYVAYFCLADAVVLVSMLSFFLLSTTCYLIVNKPLSCSTEFSHSSTCYHGGVKTGSEHLFSSAMVHYLKNRQPIKKKWAERYWQRKVDPRYASTISKNWIKANNKTIKSAFSYHIIIKSVKKTKEMQVKNILEKIYFNYNSQVPLYWKFKNKRWFVSKIAMIIL